MVKVFTHEDPVNSVNPFDKIMGLTGHQNIACANITILTMKLALGFMLIELMISVFEKNNANVIKNRYN